MRRGAAMIANDPLAAMTDMQWYMYQQRNVAFFAAFSTRAMQKPDLVEIARSLVGLAPQLLDGFAEGNQLASDDLLEPLLFLDLVDDFDAFPDLWVNIPAGINERPDLPMFRIRVAARRNGPDAQGRASFVLVQVSHALVEGADSALLSRSRTTARNRPMALPIAGRPTSGKSVGRDQTWKRIAGSLMGGPAALGHLLGASLINLRPGPYAYASLVAERREVSTLARHYDVRQRPLLFAIGLFGLLGQAALAGKSKVTATYSTIDADREARSGGFMHMHMLFSAFPCETSLVAQALAIDQTLRQTEGRPTGFGDAMAASALSVHRWLHARWPSLYKQQVFSFLPYDVVLGLIPPHRLDGTLTSHLVEPVFAGAALEGANACVIVPGREKISFNFYAQSKQLKFISEAQKQLAAAIGTLR